MIRHFGILIPSTNTTVELEYNRLLPPRLQVHIARLGKDGNQPFLPGKSGDIAYQAALLRNAKVEVIGLTQTSASLFDDNYDRDAMQWMTADSGIASVTSAEAIGQAVLALNARRIALVSPYSDTVVENARRYYETRFGLRVAAAEGFGATDAYAIGGLGPENALAAFARIDSPDIEVLVVPGGNFPTMASIAAWEAQCGKPVVTTNQALLWAMLQVMDATEPLPALGRLLADMPDRRQE